MPKIVVEDEIAKFTSILDDLISCESERIEFTSYKLGYLRDFDEFVWRSSTSTSALKPLETKYRQLSTQGGAFDVISWMKFAISKIEAIERARRIKDLKRINFYQMASNESSNKSVYYKRLKSMITSKTEETGTIDG